MHSRVDPFMGRRFIGRQLLGKFEVGILGVLACAHIKLRGMSVYDIYRVDICINCLFRI